MPQIITFCKAIVMYFYAMKMIKLGATCISDHLFKDHFCTLIEFIYCSHLSNQPKFVFIEDWDRLKCLL